MSTIRWAVLRDRYPFAIGAVIGHVNAPDRHTAQAEATKLFAGKVVVQSVASLKVGAREKPLPAPDPTRDDFGLKRRQNRDEYFRTHRQVMAKKRPLEPLKNVEPAVTNRHTDTQP